jgi:hypothetical protein
MKRLIFGLGLCLLFLGIGFCAAKKDHYDTIVGKWVSSDNVIYEFTKENELIAHSEVLATYRFIESRLMLTYSSEIEKDAEINYINNYTISVKIFKDGKNVLIEMKRKI